MKTPFRIVSTSLVLSLFASVMAVAQDNWPQWRGPGWTNVSTEKSIPVEFGNDKNLLWRVEMPGPAGSSPIVWNDNVFVTSADGDNLIVMAFDIAGKELWRQTLGGQNKSIRMDNANFASPSPMTDGEHVWATSAAGVLHCFTFDGKPVWTKDLQKEYGEFDIQFGLSTTPILDNGRLYLQLIHGSMRDKLPSVGWVISLDAKTGNEIWKFKRETEATVENKHSYTSPVIYRDDSRAFLITHGADYAIGHDLQDGHELWRMGGLNNKESYNPYLRFVSSPTCVPGAIIVPSAKNGPVLALRPEKLKGDVTGDVGALHWRLDRGTPDVASPLVDVEQKLVYLCHESGLLIVVDMENGKELFKERFFADKHRSSPVLVGNKIVITSRNGDVLVVEGGREPKVLAKNSLGEETTASPAVSNGRLFIRTFDALYAFGTK
jgi:outer membrane protein assembly factor BamB